MAWRKINPRLVFLRSLVFLGLTVLVSSCRHAGKASAADSGDKINSLKTLAGEYYHGDGLGANCSLKIGKRGSFTYAWHGCLGLYGTNYGDAHLVNGMLCLVPKKPNLDFSTPTEFFPIRWGPRVYLVATNGMVDFYDSINDGGEPRGNCYGWYYLREKDWDKPVSGRPEIPEAWAEYGLSRQIKGEIVCLLNNKEAWVNVGADDGLREGMALAAWKGNPWTIISVRISVLEKDRCLIKQEWEDEKLELGMKVGSRLTK